MTDDLVVEKTYHTFEYVKEGYSMGPVLVPVVAIVAGVFNENYRDEETIRASLPHWEGLPIINHMDKLGVGVHPPENIVTTVKQVIGKLKDVYWQEDGAKICGTAYFSEELGCPVPMLNSIANGHKYGVSSMYFRDVLNENGEVEGKKYVTRSVNILPNNLAIVDNPACPKNRCGINVEEKAALSQENNAAEADLSRLEVNNMTEEITKEYVDGLKATIEVEKTSRIAMEAEKNIIAEKLVAETAARITAETERNTLKDAAEKAAIEAKKVAFLGKFPEVSKKAAETELLPIFMEDPSKLVLEHSERYAELLSVSVETQKKPASEGNEYVPEASEEEKGITEMGVPSVEEMMASFGIKKVGA